MPVVGQRRGARATEDPFGAFPRVSAGARIDGSGREQLGEDRHPQ